LHLKRDMMSVNRPCSSRELGFWSIPTS
jgi:hypothetical protein